MVLSVSKKGWVVIPAELRKKYDLKPGKKLVVVDYGGVLGLVPALEDPLRQSAGLLAQEGKSLTQALMDEHRLEREGG